MSPDQRFFAIMTLLVALTGIVTAGFRAVWRASAKWSDVLDELKDTNEDLKGVSKALREHNTESKQEHARLREQIASVSRNIGRHIRWHAEREG